GGGGPRRQAVPAAGRLEHPLRRQRGGRHQQPEQSPGNPHLWTGRPRAARAQLHEDRVPGARGPVMLKNKPKAKARRLDLAPGDTVVVTAGKDRGKTGEVLRTLPREARIVVQGVNVVRRHTKAGQTVGGNRVMQGGVIDFESPLDYSNVMLVC